MDEHKATNDQRSMLIDLVKAHPCLWNMSSNSYHQMRNIVKNKRWLEIANAVGLDVKATKSAGTNLRSQFKRELKHCNKSVSGDGGGETDKYLGSWHFFNHLMFLRDTVIPRPTESNSTIGPSTASVEQSSTSLEPHSSPQLHNESCEIQLHDNVEEDEYTESMIIEDDLFEVDVKPSLSTTSRSTSSLSNTSNPKKRKSKAHEIGLSLEQKKIRLFEEREAHKEALRIQEENPDLQFFKSILPEVAKVCNKLRFRAQIIQLSTDFIDEESRSSSNESTIICARI